MRSLLIASAGLALAGGGAADAQQQVVGRPGTSYDRPGVALQAPMAQPRRPGPIAARPSIVHTTSQQGPHRSPRWGSKIGGRWWGGANAPGGWAGYRRPYRGWAVPTYWNAPRFYVSDWSSYGLAQPPYGYNWTRYYDDAVLIDSRGSVYDTTSGVDWDRPDGIEYAGADYAGGGYVPDDAVYTGPDDRGYDQRYDDPRYARRNVGRGSGRDNGLGGAAIGAVAGGVAGNVIAGRGNRLGGTLIGAGLGAAAGYAIDKSEDRGRRLPPPPASGYDTRYGDTRYDAGAVYAPPPVPVYDRAQSGTWVSPDGMTTVRTSNAGYQAGSTTVVIQSTPVVTTTTTTEYYDSAVTYRPKKVWRKRAWRAKPVCNCR